MSKVILSLGTNLGDRKKNLLDAIKYIEKHIGNIEKISPVYETIPWRFNAKELFYNQVIIAETRLNPFQLLSVIKNFETQAGRLNNRKTNEYFSRIIDVDILFYNNKIIQTDQLTIPHQHIVNRRFVLVPLNDIAPEYLHPVYNKPVAQILTECKDLSDINKIS